MPSQNNLIIKSLTETLQRGIDPAKVYDLVTRMNADLNTAYNTVIDGPLPAIDGFLLTRLNAASLEGEIPRSFNIAYTDENNQFWFGQRITQFDEEVPFWTFGFGDLLSDPVVDPTSFFRIGSIADGKFWLSQNILWDGAAWDRDDAALGALKLDLIDGQLSFDWWDSVLADFRNTWLWDGREQLCANFADSSYLSFVTLDANDVIHLGETAATDTTPAGHIAIPAKISTEIPLSGDADNDGIIIIDKTLNYFVWYANGLRYRVAGIAYP